MEPADDLDERTGLTNDAIYWRGLFIQRYAGIEFSLTHLLVMASYNSIYRSLGKLPYRYASKLKRLEDILSLEGPILQYATSLREHVAYFNSIEDDRHHIAHAMMVVRIVDGQQICLFRMYRHSEGEVEASVWDMPLDQLKQLAEDVQPHSTAFSALVAKIGSEHLIGQ